jgi:AraC family transcriptional regulator of adaptative response/methylated-DNA-[protein]-cysteine methyltransferase
MMHTQATIMSAPSPLRRTPAGRDAPAPSKSSYASDEARWRAVEQRDARADGCFVYGVRTTRVYARPSASARLPRRENVVFFDSPQAAEAAGYRPSRRAQADRSAIAAEHAARVAQACRAIEQADQPPALAELAAQAGMSAHHFHRVFKAQTGVTPKAYAAARRAERLRQALPHGRVTQAIYDAGFQSNSRFYETADQRLGMRASAFRAGGAGAVIRFAVGQCALGAILVAQSERGICAIWLGDDPEVLVHELQDRFARATLVGGDAAYEQLVARVVGFVEAPRLGLDLPLDVQGTAFQERVWRALREIPPGSTASYAEVAERIGAPRAVRAVARACAANPLAVAIPCHRVVRTDGALSGYRWGVARKRALLDAEARAAELARPDARRA